jgi:ABC-2 type transport system ATP-binding protein
MSTAVDPPAALEIQGLSKSYRVGHIIQGRRPVLRDLSLSVQPGEVFGFLGPNGAGKTTTLKIVTGLVRADAGRVTILGEAHQERAWRYRVGYLPENPYLYDYLTPTEYLDYVGRLFGMAAAQRRERARMLLEKVGLARAADTPLRRFSKGMVQRAGLAQALMNDPELVMLDEPMSGLDPLGRRLVRDIILELRDRGKTVFFSTHILSDAETLCDRVALLREGRLVSQGRLDEILTIDVSHLEVLVSGLGEEALAGMADLKGRVRMGERWRLEVEEASLAGVVATVRAHGGRVLSMQPSRQSLEEYFVERVGGGGERGASQWVQE